jgi:GntR family transcriptional regulator/MocR family aminotransferase
MAETRAKNLTAPDEATKASLDLHLELSGSRVRLGLETALRDAVRTGRLGPGTRLPSSRALAADLGLARNTVAEVYSQLVAEGWLTARTGSGTSVAQRRAAEPAPGPLARPEVTVPRYDLRPGVPDLSAFPGGAWLAAARRVLAAAPRQLLDYPDPRGLPQLRASLAGYLARARGVAADPGHIVICAGFAHGLAVTCAALRSAGAATLAVEAYGHQAHRDLAHGQGLGLRPLPVDASGAVIGAADGTDAALLTPAHQFPLGVTLHPRRGRRAAGACARPRRLRRHGQQEPGPRLAARLAGRPAAAAGRGSCPAHRGTFRARPAHLGRAHRFRRVRPADPPYQAGLPSSP